MSSRYVLFVGEDNPYGADPDMALYPRPINASGNRLRKILGLRLSTYLGEGIRRCNVCSTKWSWRSARRRARELLEEDRQKCCLIVVLGHKNRKLFGLSSFFEALPREEKVPLLSLPHPSGRVLIWNDREKVLIVRRLLTEYAPSVPWGEIDE